MAVPGSPREKKRLHVTSRTYSLGTPHKEYDLHALLFLTWMGNIPSVLVPVSIPYETFLEIAFKLLGTPEVKEHAPHLFITEIRFPGGAQVWGPKIMEIRRTLLGMSGQYGKPLPLEKRDVLRNGEKQHYGGIDFWFDSSDRCIHFQQSSFTLKAMAEVCAIVLRDSLTAILDKRRYIPWLIGRPNSHFDKMFLRENNMADLIKVPGWQLNLSAVADSPPDNMQLADKCRRPAKWSDEEEAVIMRVMLEGVKETPLEVVAVLDTDPTSDDSPIWGMYKVQGGYTFGAVWRNEEYQYFLDDGFPEVRFRNFAEFLKFVLEAALSSDFKETQLDCELSENTEVYRWLPRGTPSSNMLDSMNWVREVLEMLPDMNYPHALVCGKSHFETQSDDSIVWKCPGGKAALTAEDVFDLILLTVSDERTAQFPNQYFPNARRAVTMVCLTACALLAVDAETNVVDESLTSPEPVEESLPEEVATPEVVVAEPSEPPVAPAQVPEPQVVMTPLVVLEPVSAQSSSDGESSVATRADIVINDFVRDFRAGASQILANLRP